MHKLIVRMRGGLGNQLFILAFAYYISKKYGFDPEIILDTREYKTFKLRDFELAELITDDSVSLLKEDRYYIFYDITRTLFHVVQRIHRKETNSLKYLSRIGLYYGRRSGTNTSKSITKTSYIYGYFQDAEMAQFVRDKIKKEICFSKENDEHVDFPSIAISIRCGDDYKTQGWPICTEDYYKKGLDYIIKEKYTAQNIKVLVFSDEIEKAKKMEIHPNAIYVEKMNAIEQLALMGRCSDYVIANSSFSWWGSFLGRKQDSIVIMPEYWYATGEKTVDTKLVYENSVIIKDSRKDG